MAPPIEAAASLDVLPRDEDHIYFHYQDGICHPFMPEVWSQRYAEELGVFISSHTDKSDPDRNPAIAQLLLSPDWTKGRDSRILSDLHVAEASARSITKWTLQEVLWMQERLCKGGFMSTENMVNQRQTIIDVIGNTDCEKSNLEEIGARTCGLSLCVTNVWLLNSVSPELAKQLQDKVTLQYGARSYAAKLFFYMGHRRGDREMIAWAEQEFLDTFKAADQAQNEFMDALSKETQSEVFKVYRKAAGQALMRQMKEQLHSVSDQIGELGERLKQKLKVNSQNKNQ